MSSRIAVIGAGGHAKVILTLMRAAGMNDVDVYDRAGGDGRTILSLPVRPMAELPRRSRAVLAIGDNATRKRLAQSLDCDWATLVHPTACVDPSVVLGPGTVVFAGAVIQVDSTLGAHVIVNTCASIDHDGLLGDFVHLAPGTHLAGNVTLDEGAFLGVGVSVIPGRRVGAWTTVGAGAAVVRDIPPNIVAVGVPARAKASS